MRETFGLAPDEWQVIATFLGPIVGVLLAACLALRQVFSTQEANHIRERYLENGVSRLRRDILALNTISLTNFQIASMTWSTFRDNPKGFPLAPRPEDLSPLVEIDPATLSFDAATITQEVLGTPSVTKWAAYLFSDTTLALRQYEHHLLQPLQRYYDPAVPAGAFTGDRQKIIDELKALIEQVNAKATRHLRLHDILYDVELEFVRRKVRTYRQVANIRNLPRVKGLIELLEKEFKTIERPPPAVSQPTET